MALASRRGWRNEKNKIGVPVGLAACNKAKIGVAVWPAERKKAKVGVPGCRGVACCMKAS